MKKLLIFSVFVLLALVSVTALGQNTGSEPSIGSTHSYWVNGTSATNHDAGHVGSTYTWWISTTPADLKAADTSGDYTVASGGAAYNTAAADKNSIYLTWNPSSAGKTYYLVVQEDGVSPLCTNIKAYPIQPKNDFNLVFTMLAKNGTTIGDDLSRCAPDIAVSASGTTITYNYGSDDYLFKLTATGLYTNWTLDYAFANTLNGATPTYSYSTDGGATYTTQSATETALPVPASTTGTKEVFIKVNLANGIVNEGTSAQTMQLTLSNVKDAGGNGVQSIKNSVGTDITKQTQTVQARPATSGIQSN